MQFVRSFEELGFVEKIDKLVNALLQAGFEVDPVTIKSGNKNIFYSKEGVDTVFVVINAKTKGTTFYDFAIIDKDVYDNQFRGQKRVLKWNIKDNTKDKDRMKLCCNSGGSGITPIHHFPFKDVRVTSQPVDHISHNLRINNREMLRLCTNQENNYNKPCYSNVMKRDTDDSTVIWYFTIADKVTDSNVRRILENNNYTFNGGNIESPKFKSRKDMFTHIAGLENYYMGVFRYNPVIDYSQTWYAYAVHKLLGTITKAQLDDYNKDWMKRNRPYIAEYYQL